MTRWRRAHSRGFTLVELMVVVAIVGVLAVLGLVVLSKHQKEARTYETLAMVQSIRMAQERWRSENLTYLNVSASGEWFPPAAPGDTRISFLQSANSSPDGPAWIMLNPTSNPLVYGGYKTTAGLSDDPMTAPDTAAGATSVHWPSPAPDCWYVIQAIMDTDTDGRFAYYLASSLNGEVYRKNEGE